MSQETGTAPITKQVEEANLFNITGPIVIHYSRSSIAAMPQFSYKERERARQTDEAREVPRQGNRRDDITHAPLDTGETKIVMSAEPQTSFRLSITSSASGEPIASASLSCPPDGGSHPNPAGACEQLSKVDGRIEGIPEDSGPCTLEFNPVILAASGTWNGEPRYYKQEFSNRCVAVRTTGGVIFEF